MTNFSNIQEEGRAEKEPLIKSWWELLQNVSTTLEKAKDKISTGESSESEVKEVKSLCSEMKSLEDKIWRK